MIYGNERTNDDRIKCNYFSEFFSNVFLKSNKIKMQESFEKRKFNKISIDENNIKENQILGDGSYNTQFGSLP